MKYTHNYAQTLTYKILNARKPDRVFSTFEQSLDLIRAVHRLTAGIPQIVYLVGWQHDGHDSKYPSWDVVNPRLKSERDADALTSLRRLMAEARQFNATVSLHINMDDAYPNSPLWDEYVARDLIVRRPDGSLAEGAVWDGEVSYHICKPREWAAGLAQRRIDRLLDMLPIREAGTIHIDAFRPQESMAHAGVTYEQELQTVKDVVGRFREHGVDVTTEFLGGHELVGCFPMVWHLNASEQTRLAYPPTVLCGGGSAWNRRRASLRTKHAWCGGFTTPESGCLYEEAWGHSIDRDLHNAADLPAFAADFYSRTVPWHFLNRHRAIAFHQTLDRYTVEFEDGVTSEVRTADHHLTIRQGDRVLVDGGDLFCPAPWSGDAWIAYSAGGGRCAWPLPAAWCGAKEVTLTRLWPQEESPKRVLRADGCRIELELRPSEAVLVQRG